MVPALSYGAMNETRETLEARKRELFDAIRLLEQDREDGLMDEVAYASSRRRYELEAAEVLERLDHLPHERKERTTGRSTLWIALSALGLVMVALAIFLVSSLQHRTEARPPPLPTVSSVLATAQRAAAAHPRDVDAQLVLGNAYLDAGQNAQADAAYQRAIRLAPGRPEGRTLHAMMLGAGGRRGQALVLLRQVERSHPRYARAWLLDGLIASRTSQGQPRALAAWRHFLQLQPHGRLSPSVHRWMSALQRKQKR
jgi:cytochrome c-type biogenesis protein CcmH/NrfG